MPPVELTPLLNGGAIACVLAWFMFKAEPRLKGIEDAIDRQSRALLMWMLQQEGAGAGIKTQATTLLAEVTEAENARKR